ncbi:MAG: tRNA (N6-isopentenyl adenosine(37)-C2)-methylthiotransferase MiaB [Candidatus Omnitrophica bacterium]|nr:tRNA (N6-isopentenyl adenosine(37)-C2)-methylthiotransferase MiaB [Candidatus Omnitrophota bacterium]
MNMRDSEMVLEMLQAAGYGIATSIEGADIVLFNTCSVRQHAEDRVIGNIRALSTRKKKNPNFKIGVLGCMAERHGEMLFKEYPCLDIVSGPNNIYEVPELLNKVLDTGEKVSALKNKKRSRKKVGNIYWHGGISAFVNIVYGCNNYCSYCIVPYVRGREVSRPKNDILDEIRELVDKGAREITLLGQNVNSYGKGLTNKITFPELLEEVNGISGVERVRFTTSHPKDADKRLFRAIHDLDKVCENLHLPLQSGSNKMLDLMNRKYSYEEYLKKIQLLKSMVPDVGLSTDIVVGFPSEKEKDYKATYKALEEIEYNSAFVFKYSPRPPALSSCLVDDVAEEAKRERNNELLALQKKIAYKKNKNLIGTRQEVLIEKVSRMSDNEMVGRTRGNIACVVRGGENLIGQLVQVEITGNSAYTLKSACV